MSFLRFFKMIHLATPMFMIIFFVFLIQASMGKDENPLYEMSSREEMVQMAGYGEEKLSTVLVTGTVLCEACLQGEAQLLAWPVAGALVVVGCHAGDRSRSGWARAITDEYGDFLIDLPSHLHAVPDLEETCSVKVVQIPKKMPCRPTHVRKHKGLRLSSVGNGIRTYTAGRIRFQHLTLKPSQACVKAASGTGDRQIA